MANVRSFYNKVELIHLRLGDDELCCTLGMSTLARTTGCQTPIPHQHPATFSMWTKTICQGKLEEEICLCTYTKVGA